MSGKLLAMIIVVYVIGVILGATYEGTWALENSTVTGTITDGSGTLSVSPTTLVDGANTITVTGLGTFIIVMPTGGVVGTAVSVAPCLVTGSPKNLIGGTNTIITTGAVGTITVTINGWMTESATPLNMVKGMFNIKNAVEVKFIGIIPYPVPNSDWFETWYKALTFRWSFIITNFELVWYVVFLPFALMGVASMVTLFIGMLQGNISWS